MKDAAELPLAAHRRRVRRLLLLAGAVIGGTGVFWAAVFAWQGHWPMVGLDLATAALGATTAALTLRGHTRAASRLVIAVTFALVSFNAIFADLPTLEAPRSVHHFLLVLGVMSALLMRDEPPWLRHGVPALCLLTYMALASTNAGVPSALALPEAVRVYGVWVNGFIAAVAVSLTLHVIQTDTAQRSRLEAELGHALLHQELRLHYQPQVDRSGRIVGAEALARWQHPLRGMVPPNEFVPIAEQSGLMVPLGNWVLHTACAQLALWAQRPETANLRLAVNVSASQFAQSDIVSRVLGCVAQHGANPAQLKLELTESTLAHDLEDVIAKMTALKAHGIGFSLDDFGTGFSSLTYLRRLPLDQLKIDQSFVNNMLGSAKDAAIAQAVVTLGKSLKLEVIAEGVETVAQRAFLADLGCHSYQGYLFSRPLPVVQFDALVLRNAAPVPTLAAAQPHPQTA
ncbi:MAG: EAL domain-containing protein [Rubrivivax sp.]|nr:EAL domain-containing protein [Rubrivivax sp.]